VGIVVHTKYHGPSMEKMHAGFDPDLANFKHHSDVHMISPEAEMGMHDSSNEVKYNYHMKRAEGLHIRAPVGMYDTIKSHSGNLNTYINHAVREGSKPSVEGYIKHVVGSGGKGLEDLKTAKAKQARYDKIAADAHFITDHHKQFDNALRIHHHIQSAKNALIDSLAKGTTYEHSIGGKAAKPEGFVAIHNGYPVKLVNRDEFSRANFQRNH